MKAADTGSLVALIILLFPALVHAECRDGKDERGRSCKEKKIITMKSHQGGAGFVSDVQRSEANNTASASLGIRGTLHATEVGEAGNKNAIEDIELVGQVAAGSASLPGQTLGASATGLMNGFAAMDMNGARKGLGLYGGVSGSGFITSGLNQTTTSASAVAVGPEFGIRYLGEHTLVTVGPSIGVGHAMIALDPTVREGLASRAGNPVTLGGSLRAVGRDSYRLVVDAAVLPFGADKGRYGQATMYKRVGKNWTLNASAIHVSTDRTKTLVGGRDSFNQATIGVVRAIGSSGK